MFNHNTSQKINDQSFVAYTDIELVARACQLAITWAKAAIEYELLQHAAEELTKPEKPKGNALVRWWRESSNDAYDFPYRAKDKKEAWDRLFNDSPYEFLTTAAMVQSEYYPTKHVAERVLKACETKPEVIYITLDDMQNLRSFILEASEERANQEKKEEPSTEPTSK